MKTVQQIARQYADLFTTATRDNGEKFYKTEDDRPEELTNLL